MTRRNLTSRFPFSTDLALVGALFLTALAGASGIASAADMKASAPRPMGPAVGAVVERLVALPDAAELALFLGPTPAQVDSRRHRPEARLGRLMDDPALAEVYPRIDDRWLAVPGTEDLRRDTRSAIETKVMLARNLYFRDQSPSAATVRHELARILTLRHRYGTLPMFAGRQVVFAASDDERRGGGHVFGRLATRRRLGQVAGEVAFLRRGETADLGGRLSAAFDAAPRLTFLFEGHGRRDALKLDGAFTPRDLARLLVARAELAGDATPILILDACESHDFARQLLRELERLAPAVRPILVTPEEYGQDFVKPGHGDPFLDRDLGLPYRDDVPLGVLFEQPRTMASVYVPGDDGRPAQIL